MSLKLYNTISKEKELFKPIKNEDVRMYVCGPTLYNNPHIGNFRPIVIFDLLFRLLRDTYNEDHVTYVRNITDIDDKIINKCKELSKSTEDLVKDYKITFQKDLISSQKNQNLFYLLYQIVRTFQPFLNLQTKPNLV